ncbi:MAG: hypothetical protein OHK0039_34840 [Bacteroidia bacterium]
MNSNLFVVMLSGILALWMTGCGSPKLDRARAAQLIEAYYQYPNMETQRVTTGSAMPSDASRYRPLIQEGLIYFRKAVSPYDYLDRDLHTTTWNSRIWESCSACASAPDEAGTRLS